MKYNITNTTSASTYSNWLAFIGTNSLLTAYYGNNTLQIDLFMTITVSIAIDFQPKRDLKHESGRLRLQNSPWLMDWLPNPEGI